MMNYMEEYKRHEYREECSPVSDYENYGDMYTLLGTSLIRAFSFSDYSRKNHSSKKKKELQTVRFPNIMTEIKKRIGGGFYELSSGFRRFN